ncbi:hypothetical protein HNR10_000251 [Nocardiopsis aegyptia]|uniref:Uncharacterized protein n=1 Tax=Nocardiopsis aegyptia TaxID=220378 RepID=A0A7Z0J8J7_9ACTN|nr:hypothetical protein [Nocardiopsis aegyptia]
MPGGPARGERRPRPGGAGPATTPPVPRRAGRGRRARPGRW